jgi:hypothetical protein
MKECPITSPGEERIFKLANRADTGSLSMKGLLRDPEFDHLQFVMIPASGSIRVEHPLSLEQILRENLTVRREELKVGMKYRVWMRHSLLCSAGRYSYWGDMEVELKDQKLSSYSPNESPAEEVGYSAEVIAADGWTIK